MTDEVLIQVDHVSKKFCQRFRKSLYYGMQDLALELIGSKEEHKLRSGEFWSVSDVSFNLKRGECLGLIGPNGSGKSTLLKMINGLIKPDRGRIEVRGRVGALIELGAGFNPILTGRENIYANGTILGLTIAEIDSKLDAIIEFAEIEEFIDTPIQNYSSGMKVRLGFAVAAHMEPDVLIIDEVLAVGDVGFRAKCFNAIYQMIKKAAVVMVTHQLPQVSRVCSDIIVLNQGKCEFQGKDVAKGIDIFYTYFKGEKGTIGGNGKATIYDVDFECQGKRGIDSINYLDELSVCIDFEVDSDIEAVSIAVGFLTPELQHAAQCVSLYNNFQIINTGERMQVVVNLGQINFNPGSYALEILINEVQHRNLGEILIRSQNLKKIRVAAGFYSQVPIQMQGNWQVLF
uniref:ABC transporter related protein n=2 Tax=Gloeothece TaxID=28070 RepID=E0UGK1_GLOV7|nr:ABC transporter related protein [Gloeothece verrucosa PCC 7822]